MMKKLLLIFLMIFVPMQLVAKSKTYGSYVYLDDLPHTLFLIGDIKPRDVFYLRKALRNHDIQTIVLASPGGDVFEGLNMAGVIFDKELRVYVPRGAKCASACAYMFFAGKERKVKGELGVHQFYSNKKVSTSGTQFTVSEIIGFLNEFETPGFVLERMFQQKEMYWFGKKELEKIESSSYTIDSMELKAIDDFWTNLLDELAKTQPTIAQIQKRLNELGCNAGPVDGKPGNKTISAILRFSKKAGISYTSNDKEFSNEFIKKMNSAPKNFCILGYPNFTFAKGYYPCCSSEECSKSDERSMKVLGYDKKKRKMEYERQDGFLGSCILKKDESVKCSGSSSDTRATYKANDEGLVLGFYWLDNNGNMLCEYKPIMATK